MPRCSKSTLQRLSSVHILITAPKRYSVKDWNRQGIKALLKRRTDTLYGQFRGVVFNVGVSADQVCENEAIMMKLDVFTGNGSLLLMTKFGVGI